MQTNTPSLEALRIDRTAPRPARRRRWLWLGLAVLIVGGAAVALKPVTTPVEVTRLAAGSGAAPDVVLSAGGYIVAHHKINVNSKVTGRVAWIGVEKGDHVNQGQVLVRLEDEEFKAQVVADQGAVDNAQAYLDELRNGPRPEERAEALNNLQQAQATQRMNQLNLQRTKALAAQGIVPQSQLDNDQATFDASQHLADSLQQAYALARIGTRPEEIQRAAGALKQAQGALAYAQTELDATLIRAPVSGTILDRTAEKGELITAQFASAADTGGPQGSVVTLADLNDLQVELDIAQNDFGRVHLNQAGVITTDAYPDKKYQGVLAEIAPEANRQKATVQVKVRVLRPDGLLRPDMNATVQFLADASGAASAAPAGVLVPLAAIHDREGAKYVWVMVDGKAAERPITVTAQRAQGSLATGVAAGDEVIVKAPDSLKAGDRVAVAAPAGPAS